MSMAGDDFGSAVVTTSRCCRSRITEGADRESSCLVVLGDENGGPVSTAELA